MTDSSVRHTLSVKDRLMNAHSTAMPPRRMRYFGKRTTLVATAVAPVIGALAVWSFDTTKWVETGYTRTADASAPARPKTGPVVGDEAFWLARAAQPAAQPDALTPTPIALPAPPRMAGQQFQLGDKVSIGTGAGTRTYQVTGISMLPGEPNARHLDATRPTGTETTRLITLTSPGTGDLPADIVRIVTGAHVEVSAPQDKAL